MRSVVQLAVSIPIVALLLTSSAQAQCPQGVITGNDTFTSDQFGQSLGISGDYAIVGAHYHDGVGFNSGSAYIFERVGGLWSEVADLEASDITSNDRFGWSSAISSDVAAVGARYNNDAGYGSGSVYIFERSTAGVWSESAKMVASVETSGDFFGNALAVSGDTIVVGTPGYDVPFVDSGAVYVLDKVAGVWTETTILTVPSGKDGDNLGSRVAIDSGILVAGARGVDKNGAQSGAAYVFEQVGGIWTFAAELLAGDGAAGDLFGSAVSIHENTIVVGSILHDGTGTDMGAAYVFERIGANWVQTAKLKASDAQDLDYFGASVAVYGNNLLVGAFGADAGGVDLGSAYKFQKVDGKWVETSVLSGSGANAAENFGFSVSLSGATAIVGARGEIGGGESYLFSDFDKAPLYGTACAGLGGFAPILSLSGCPAPGGSASIDIRLGEGGSTAFLFVGLAPDNLALVNGCSLLLDPLPDYFAFPLSGAGPGQGSFSLPVTIPSNLAATSIYMQAFLLDSGAFYGYTVTNGLELIIP